MILRRAVCLAAMLVACGDRRVLDGATASSSSSSETGSSGAALASDATSSSSTTNAPTSDASTSSAAETSSEDDGGCPFVCPPDVGAPLVECDVWAQNCPSGWKCMPWANDGGYSWNATRCTPIDPNAVGIGEACTVQESGVSGIDDCERGAMCFDVDPRTNTGTCYAFCGGSEGNPVCENANEHCSIWNEGVLILCIDPCDPFVQTCDDGNGCYSFQDSFHCMPDFQNQALYGEPCEYDYACEVGLFCAEPATVPDCASNSGCCSSFCDLQAPAPDTQCYGEGQVCIPWYEPGQAPPGLAHVGACALPP